MIRIDYTMLVEDGHTGQYFMISLSKTSRISELLSPSLERLKLRWLFGGRSSRKDIAEIPIMLASEVFNS